MSLESLLNGVKRKAIAGLVLLGTGLNSEAGIVKVNGKRLDVKGSEVIRLEDGKSEEDPETRFKAKYSDMVLGTLENFDRVNMDLGLKYWDANASFLGSLPKPREAVLQATEFLGAYLTGDLKSLSKEDIIDGAKAVVNASNDDVEELTLRLFKDGGERLRENIGIYEKVKRDGFLSYEDALIVARNGDYLTVVAPDKDLNAKKAYVGTFLKNLRSGLVGKVAGIVGLDADKSEGLADRIYTAVGNDGKVDEFFGEGQNKLNEMRKKRAEELHKIGSEFFVAGQYTLAIPFFRSAIELEPNNATLYNSLGASLDGIGKFHESVELYMTAYKLDPKNEQVVFNLIVANSNIGTRESHLEAAKFAAEYLMVGTDPTRKNQAFKYITAVKSKYK